MIHFNVGEKTLASCKNAVRIDPRLALSSFPYKQFEMYRKAEEAIKYANRLVAMPIIDEFRGGAIKLNALGIGD